MTIEDESFKATVKVLSEYIKHHVKEEETEMFPKLKKTELDLKDLGAQLATRKMELMEEMGIEEEAESAAPRRRATSRAKTSTRAKARSGARRSASRSSTSRSTRH